MTDIIERGAANGALSSRWGFEWKRLGTFVCVQVNMIKDDGTVIHFNNPKVQASVPANTFAVVGHGENKRQ